MKNVLTIAGSDCSGGAGVQADLKTMCAHKVFAMSVITAVTAQNTQGVFAVQDIKSDIIAKQIDAIFTDIDVHAVKIGMVSSVEAIKVIAKKLKEYNAKNVVLDPVMISKSGFNLLKPEAKEILVKELLPLAKVITPNLPEAEEIIKTFTKREQFNIHNEEGMQKACRVIYDMGCENVLVKGGHLKGDAVDILFDGIEIKCIEGKRINTKNTHGTGCTLSSAIASNLALGKDVYTSIKLAKEYITEAIEHSINLGKGVGPTNHFYSLYKKAGMFYE